MSAALQAALVFGAWIGIVLLLAGGFWFLRRNQLLHTALTVVLVLVGLLLLIRLRELLIMLVLAGVMAFVLDGPVGRLARRLPRPLAIGIIYLCLVSALAVTGTLVIPRIVRQARLLVQELPRYTDQAKALSARLSRWVGETPEQVQNAFDAAIEQLQAASGAMTRTVERTLLEVLRWTVRGVLILIISIYLLTDHRKLHDQVVGLFSSELRPEVEVAMAELAETFSRYLRGQLTVILFVAIAVTIVLILFGIPYAFLIGFMAGVLEVIPYFGAVAGAVPAVALGFAKSPTIGVSLIVFFIIINQIEGHVVIPLVMGGHLEMRPLAILLSLIGGEILFGIVGMIIAVPAVSLTRVLAPHVLKHYRLLQARERLQAAPKSRG
jgi:predicted PurR-regulated permease PerM